MHQQEDAELHGSGSTLIIRVAIMVQPTNCLYTIVVNATARATCALHAARTHQQEDVESEDDGSHGEDPKHDCKHLGLHGTGKKDTQRD